MKRPSLAVIRGILTRMSRCPDAVLETYLDETFRQMEDIGNQLMDVRSDRTEEINRHQEELQRLADLEHSIQKTCPHFHVENGTCETCQADL